MRSTLSTVFALACIACSNPAAPDCPAIRAEVAELRGQATVLRQSAASMEGQPGGADAARAMRASADAIDAQADQRATPACGPY